MMTRLNSFYYVPTSSSSLLYGVWRREKWEHSFPFTSTVNNKDKQTNKQRKHHMEQI